MVDEVEFLNIDSQMEMDAPDVCGDCIYFTGEECNGKFEGNEKNTDSQACDEFDPCEYT